MTGTASRVHVKVCGTTRLEDARLACELGASAVGFVFWPGSPRYIDPFRARRIVAELPAFVTPVGVFVDQPQEDVEAIANLVRLGSVQLHGDESIDYCESLRHRVIKAVGVGAGDISASLALPARVTLLLDAHDPVRRGGTGQTIDWEMANRIASARRVILAGGLRPENVADAIRVVRPYGIDVSSGIEERPGIKSAHRMCAFFEQVRRRPEAFA